jgi:hypothetical protein
MATVVAPPLLVAPPAIHQLALPDGSLLFVILKVALYRDVILACDVTVFEQV